jgi:UDPglucose 6-dehydrogenase
MSPGIGYGGSCFPKDVRALEKIASGRNYEAVLLRAVESINLRQIELTFAKIVAALEDDTQSKTVGVLGMAFKPNTDDIREAPALQLIERLLDAGVSIRAHDPIAATAVRAQFGERIVYCDHMYEAIHDADAMLLATEWNEYKNLDFAMVRKLMRGNKVIDGRNLFDPDMVVSNGLDYIGVGRQRARHAGAPVQRI